MEVLYNEITPHDYVQYQASPLSLNGKRNPLTFVGRSRVPLFQKRLDAYHFPEEDSCNIILETDAQ
jgi:hypothetical protein